MTMPISDPTKFFTMADILNGTIKNDDRVSYRTGTAQAPAKGGNLDKIDWTEWKEGYLTILGEPVTYVDIQNVYATAFNLDVKPNAMRPDLLALLKPAAGYRARRTSRVIQLAEPSDDPMAALMTEWSKETIADYKHSATHPKMLRQMMARLEGTGTPELVAWARWLVWNYMLVSNRCQFMADEILKQTCKPAEPSTHQI